MSQAANLMFELSFHEPSCVFMGQSSLLISYLASSRGNAIFLLCFHLYFALQMNSVEFNIFWWSNANMDLALLLTINVSFLWTACSIFFSFSFKARPTIIPLPPPYALPPPHHLNVPQMAWLILPRAFLSHVALPRPFPSQLEATALMCHQYYAMVLLSITYVAL